MFGARRVAVTNHAHPSLARGCPRRQSSLARLRALCGSAPFAALRHAPAPPPSPRWPCASRAPLRCSSHARGTRAPASRCGGQSGKPSRRKRVQRAVRVCAHAVRGCGAPREVRRVPASLRSHRAASGYGFAFASLSLPRETSRSICLPIARGGVASPPPSRHSYRLSPPRRPPRASGVERLAMLAPLTSKGARRRALATPLARGEPAARCACPLARIYGRKR